MITWIGSLLMLPVVSITSYLAQYDERKSRVLARFINACGYLLLLGIALFRSEHIDLTLTLKLALGLFLYSVMSYSLELWLYKLKSDNQTRYIVEVLPWIIVVLLLKEVYSAIPLPYLEELVKQGVLPLLGFFLVFIAISLMQDKGSVVRLLVPWVVFLRCLEVFMFQVIVRIVGVWSGILVFASVNVLLEVAAFRIYENARYYEIAPFINRNKLVVMFSSLLIVSGILVNMVIIPASKTIEASTWGAWELVAIAAYFIVLAAKVELFPLSLLNAPVTREEMVRKLKTK